MQLVQYFIGSKGEELEFELVYSYSANWREGFKGESQIYFHFTDCFLGF